MRSVPGRWRKDRMGVPGPRSDRAAAATSLDRCPPTGCAMLPWTPPTRNAVMAKGLDKKKEQKKKPAKTMKEKRAEKNEKKTTRGFMPT